MKGGPILFECPVDGCRNMRRSARYAVCMDCWHLVPIPLRDRIRGYWGAVKSTAQGGTPAEQHRVARGFAAAKQEAVDAVNQRRAMRRAAA